ncbi:MAG TPA: hypothetical protein VMM60_02035 [Ilumatobacter sp.]|nr:hypothetical protein [Ilumatobacter sp.]
MAATRQPIDRVIDLAIGLPIATAVAARRSAPLVAQAARLGMRRVTRRSRRHSSTSHTSAVPTPAPIVVPAASEPIDNITTHLPIDDYDHLAARQVVDRLATLSAAELDQVAEYERAHRHRQTVLGRIAQLQS